MGCLMPCSPRRNYDYSRAGVMMVTLKTRDGVWLCRITQETFALTDVGRVVQRELAGISGYYGQVKVGQYQIMPDHLHMMVHVVRDLPRGITLQEVVRGFKLGVNRAAGGSVFDPGGHHTLVFDGRHLQREVAYIRDNVRRYRLRKTAPAYFRTPFAWVADDGALWCFGNRFLLEHPRRLHVRYSRRMTEGEWAEERENVLWRIEQGYVFVSPFVSPCEVKARDLAVGQGGRIIHLTDRFMDERYKPGGLYFELCCEGRLLEVSAARLFPRAGISLREKFLRMNALAEKLSCSQSEQDGRLKGAGGVGCEAGCC